MTKFQKRHRIIATFFLLIFFPTILPNNLFASNNGPVAPEATSFEPIDATDMVNLNTGDMSYVLPLLNVPSPEGGYPLSLSNHAGIAMDQEASWVGLGWSLNPGAINRSVKGVPDDWDQTRTTELLYDQGQTLNYYNLSIGGMLPNGLTIGMSTAWGAHKAWGGIIGYGGGFGLKLDLGSEDAGITASLAGARYRMGQNTGQSVGLSLKNVDLNYDSETKALSWQASLKLSSALGISLSSNGNNTITLYNSSISSSSKTNTIGDYYQNVSTNGFNINALGFFWVQYQKTQVSYSLFKLTNSYSSGILNLFDSKKESQYKQDKNSSMDVRSHNIIDKNRPSSTGLFTQAEIILPNYDNYSATAQGMSGTFSPRIYDEVMLYGRGDESNDLTTYLTYPTNTNDSNYKLNNKLFFYFDNVNSSFLRTQTGDFKSLDTTFNLDNNTVDSNGSNYMGRFVNNIVTDTDNTFSSNFNKDGQLTKVGNRKRDGQYIEAFTNKQIVDGNTGQTPFLESADFDRQYYKNIAENGIGAYRITALDGKVYHYSLPVYSFEEVYKNYSNINNENDKFLETIKTKPYATHWLLTAITGPDYVDINNNNIIDKDDYGYYVQFEYGKWSDGYGWRSPKVGGKTYNEKNLYFWGRKQIYYLDKIKTRTHTALFVKSIRNDDKSTSIQYRNGQYQSGAMPINLTQNFQDRIARPIEQGYYYVPVSSGSNTYQYLNFNYDYDYKHRTYKYVDLPENLSLKLDKIILLKNSDAINVNKNLGIGTNRKKGYVYFDFGFFGAYDVCRKNPYDVKIADINTDQTVLDAEDIRVFNQSQGYDIQTKAVKVINFNYDYSLGSNLPNASNGRLALRSLEFNGKSNTKTMPPYKFNYSKSSVPYNFTNSDNWGYIKDNPDAWSLNEIITPNGGKIKIDYEPDSFSREAAFNSNAITRSAESFYRVPEPRYNIPIKYSIQNNILTINSDFKYPSDNLNDIFSINQEINLSFQFKNPSSPSSNSPDNKEFLNSYTIIGINNTNKTLTLKPNDRTDIDLQKRFFEGPYCSIVSGDGGFTSYVYSYSQANALEYAYSFRVIANYNALIGQYGRNGKNGGGLRVKRITTSDFNNGNTLFTDYDYRNPYTTNISGVTSFEPSDNPQVADKIQAVEEIPSPNVQYEYVTATIKNNSEALASSLFNFRVMDDIIMSDPKQGEYDYKFGDQFYMKFYGGSRRQLNSNHRQVSTSKITLYDNFSSLGQLLSVKHFNSKQQLISQTINKYKKFQYDDRENGISQESYKYAIQEYTNRNVINVKDYRYTFNSIGKVTFPSRLESTTTTKNGWSNTNYYENYDFLTGQANEVRNINSDGEITKTKIVPAYLKYGGMGSKVDNPSINKNMLSQVAVNYSYMYDKNGGASKPWKETGVGITTWNNIWSYKNMAGATESPTLLNEKIWRKHKSYIWNGNKDSNGIFIGYISGNNYDTDDDFKWNPSAGETQSTRWKQISEITLYDHFSAPLETKDINGNYASTKMGDNNTKITAVGNAGYNEMFFAGGESSLMAGFANFIEPEVIMNNASLNATYSHTGKKSIAVTSSSQFGVAMKSGQHRAGRYRVSVWAEKANASKARINNNGTVIDFSESYSAGNWVLKVGYVTATSGVYSIYLTSSDTSIVYFDDLMIRPISSSINGYVYNEWDELSYIIGNNGLATRFEYDAGGRLIKTYSEVLDDTANQVTGGFKLLKTNTYNNRYLN
ncbi:hypothetical protein ACWA1F_00625 [Flavobacterium sp. 3-218]